MAIKPILFNGPMVRAILREIENPGTGKTQTRRVINFPGVKNVMDFVLVGTDQRDRRVFEMKGDDGQFITRPTGKRTVGAYYWPKYTASDLLYIRETWSEAGTKTGAGYAADYDHDVKGYGWRPSIHMPRWASRITLDVTDVRVERVQDISEEDAIAEGVVWSDEWKGWIVPGVDHPNRDFPVLSRGTAREMYAALWDVINGSGAWLSNPWVTATEFRPHLANVDDFVKRRAAV